MNYPPPFINYSMGSAPLELPQQPPSLELPQQPPPKLSNGAKFAIGFFIFVILCVVGYFIYDYIKKSNKTPTPTPTSTTTPGITPSQYNYKWNNKYDCGSGIKIYKCYDNNQKLFTIDNTGCGIIDPENLKPVEKSSVSTDICPIPTTNDDIKVIFKENNKVDIKFILLGGTTHYKLIITPSINGITNISSKTPIIDFKDFKDLSLSNSTEYTIKLTLYNYFREKEIIKKFTLPGSAPPAPGPAPGPAPPDLGPVSDTRQYVHKWDNSYDCGTGQKRYKCYDNNQNLFINFNIERCGIIDPENLKPVEKSSVLNDVCPIPTTNDDIKVIFKENNKVDIKFILLGGTTHYKLIITPSINEITNISSKTPIPNNNFEFKDLSLINSTEYTITLTLYNYFREKEIIKKFTTPIFLTNYNECLNSLNKLNEAGIYKPGVTWGNTSDYTPEQITAGSYYAYNNCEFVLAPYICKNYNTQNTSNEISWNHLKCSDVINLPNSYISGTDEEKCINIIKRINLNPPEYVKEWKNLNCIDNSDITITRPGLGSDPQINDT